MLLGRFPNRRPEVLVVLLLSLASLGLQWVMRYQEEATGLSLATMEFLLPLQMGIIAAGLVADDPAVELLLTSPRPVYRTLAERMGILLGLALFLGAAVQLLARGWGIRFPIEGLKLAFAWLSPTLFCTGIAGAVALLRGRMLDGAMACLLWSGFSIVSIPLMNLGCPAPSVKLGCALISYHPLLTMIRPLDPNWIVNRLIWLDLGVLLIWVCLALVRREEPFLQATAAE